MTKEDKRLTALGIILAAIGAAVHIAGLIVHLIQLGIIK